MTGSAQSGVEIDRRYLLEKEIGQGGMGAVFRAKDLALDRRVAIKLLLPELVSEAKAREQFQREIASAVQIEHPHVVPVYDAGFDGSQFFIVMRLVESLDLATLIAQEGRLAEGRAMNLFGQIGNALDAVHGRGLVHRDVKPANVLVWGAGTAEEHCFLTDFGIAKALNAAGTLSRLGPIGTPAYMAPEVCAHQPASPLSDEYSLGVLAYEMLSGRLPFEGEEVATLQAQLHNEPRTLAEDAPTTSPEVRAAIERAMSRDPESRFSSVKEFCRAGTNARASFDESQAITDAMEPSKTAEETAANLQTSTSLSDARIAELAELDRAKVVRMRRQAARTALTGQPSWKQRSSS